MGIYDTLAGLLGGGGGDAPKSSGLDLNDPNTIGLVSLGLRLMQPTATKMSTVGQLGSAGLLGLQDYAQAKQAERQNRQSDLQQLTGLQSALYASEFPRMASEGASYVPSPQLAEVNKRIQDLAMGSNLSSRNRATTGAAGAPPSPASAPPMQPPQASPPPGLLNQNFSGANPDFDPSMLGRGAGQVPSLPPPPPSMPPQLPPQPPMPPPAAGGVPMPLWMMASRAGPGAMAYVQQMAKDNAPINSRAGSTITVRGPDGQYRQAFYAPQLAPGVIPQRSANGDLVGATELPGFKDASADLAGATAGAQQRGKQAETYVDVPIGGGQTKRMTNAQYQQLIDSISRPQMPPGMPPMGAPQGGPPQGAPPIPPEVLAADRSGQPFVASQAPNGPVRFQPPPVPSVGVTPAFGGGGGLGVTPNPVAQAAALADAEAAAKNRQSVMKDDYQALATQNANAQTVISRLQTIKQLGPQAIMGAEVDKRDFLNGLLALAGLKGANDAKTAGDLIDKNAAQIALAIGAGSQGTDALRSLALVANPSRHMNLEAMQKAADSLVAPLQMTQAKTQLLTPHFTNGDAGSYLTQKQAFERAADPRVWELQNLSPAQQKAYVQGLSPADAQQLLASRARLREMKVLR